MGIFSRLFGGDKAQQDINVSFGFTKPSPVAERIAELNRAATRYKDEKDWDKAIACLREASDLTPKSNMSYAAEHYTRLPLFLQQGGRFEEAMQEFESLLASVPGIIAKEFAHQNKTTRTMLEHAYYYTIYDKMRLACKRQKLIDKAAEYEALYNEHKAKHAKMLEKSLRAPKRARRT